MFSIKPNCFEVVFNPDFRFSLTHHDINLVRTWMIGNILQGGKAVAVFNRVDPFTEARISFVYKPATSVPHPDLIESGIFEVVIEQRAITLNEPKQIVEIVDILGGVIESERFPYYPIADYLGAYHRNDVYFLGAGHSFIAGHDIFCFGEPQGWNEIRLNGETPQDSWVQRVDVTLE